MFSQAAISAVPTVEGLFRNSSNKEISSEGLVVAYSIEEQQNEFLMQKTESEVQVGDLEGEMLKEYRKPIFVREKILFGEDGRSLQSLRYIYEQSTMKTNDLIKVKFSPSYHAKIINEFDVNKRLLNSILMMYFTNNSEIIGTLLRDKGNGFKSNKDLLDPDKVTLLERYKEYLIATKEDPDLRNELSSPLNPTDLEERGKVLDLMKKNIYQKTGQVKLVKNKNDFYWQANLGPIEASFTNEGHRLKTFKLQLDGQIEATTGDYILFNGIHELPKIMFFKANNGRVYKVQFLTLKHYQNMNKSFKKETQKIGDIEKKLRENGIVYSEHPLII